MFVENNISPAPQRGHDQDEITHPEPADTHLERPTRVDFREPARVRIATSLIRVQTIDISAAGAKLDLCATMDCNSILHLFTPGTIILLTITGMVEPRLCQIRWRSGSRIGVQFDTPISQKTLDCIMEHAGAEERASCVLQMNTPEAQARRS